MTDNANVAATRKAYAAFSNGDFDVIREFLDPNVVWHQGGHDALSGTYRGIDEVLGLFIKEFELTGGDVKAELVEVYATDTRTIAIERMVAHRNGKTLDQTFPIVFDGQDGKAREVWVYAFGDDERSADFWS
jgi:ketosteroid isomerase-like protein